MNKMRAVKAVQLILLATIAILAISTSAAQANWLLLRNKTSVLQLQLTGDVLLSKFLVPAVAGLELHCSGGAASVTTKLEKEHAILTVSGSAKLTSCVLVGAEKTCTVKSPGAAAGELVLSFQGKLYMKGETTYSLISSEEFTTKVITGALCPLNETEEVVAGSIILTLLDPLTDAATHLVELDDDELLFGQEKLLIHGELKGEEQEAAVLVHFKEVTAGTWAIHLVGL